MPIGTMVVRSERPEIHTKPQHNLGPGSYEASVPTFKPKSGMAPFSSTTERRTGELPLNTPGPGSYAPPPSSIKVSSRPSPQFASTSERMMGERARARMMELPGPGAYTGDLVKDPPIKTQSIPGSFHRGKGINWVKVATAPSIPASGQNHGYEEGRGGQLVQQSVPPLHTGVGMDVPGPGSYDASIDKIKNYGKLQSSFGKPSSKKPAENFGLGPGSYEGELVIKAKADRPNSMFASTTGRSKLAPDSYGPGPGAFKVKSSFPSLVEHLAANPDTYSAFGSSSANPRPDPRRDEIPGPGSYISELNKPRTVAKGGATSCFNSGAVRFGSAPSTVPGPGAYSEGKVGFVDRLQQKRNGRYGVFGTTSPRFTREVTKDVPPVGTYETNKPETNPADLRRKDLRSSAFRSTAPKSPAIVTAAVAKQDAERPLCYDSKIDWPKPYNNSKVFVSSVPRFTSNRHDEEVPGPGSYNTSNFKPGAPNQKAPSFGKGSRFDSVGFENTPGPGSYHSAGSLNKKTFNITVGGTWES